MSDENEKLSSDEVPDKFSEWLLAMGCPSENVPCLDNIKQMCRGQYYIVWRSLMEEVEPKDSIKFKRQLVFYDDMQKCQEKNVFNECNANVIVPDELSLWSEHTNLKEKVADTEALMVQIRKDLQNVMDKVTSKLAQRNLLRRHTQDTERRMLLLQKLAEELKTKKSDLAETMSIANSLSYVAENVDIESKLDKCITAMRRQSSRLTSQSLLSVANPVACSSIASTNSDIDYEEQVSSVVRCRGDALWARACERRAGLCGALASACARPFTRHIGKTTAKSALAHTTALHCTIALEAMKNMALVRQAQKRLAAAIAELNVYLTGDACEYLVLHCEQIRAKSRVDALRTCLEVMTSRGDVFACGGRQSRDKHASRRQIANIDKAIISKKDELKRLQMSLATIERKILNIRECLSTVFSCLQSRARSNDIDRFRGQISLPQESIATLQQFYEERRVKHKNKMELSLDLDVSGNGSYIECAENVTPKFIDELKIYLDKFSLEKNRKLVLENGEKIWTFETLQSSLDRVHTRWQSEDVSCPLVCPAVRLASNVRRLACDVTWAGELEWIASGLDEKAKEKYVEIDMTSKTSQEHEAIDKIKKRLNENLVSLQKISRTLDLGSENLQFWAANIMCNYINVNRAVAGKTYKEYEKCYLDSFRL